MKKPTPLQLIKATLTRSKAIHRKLLKDSKSDEDSDSYDAAQREYGFICGLEFAIEKIKESKK